MKNYKVVKIKLGYCPCCSNRTLFVANDYWLRDHYHCLFCHSIPRQRAIMKVLSEYRPDYQTLKIHESSPSGPVFKKLQNTCTDYTYSYFYENLALGSSLAANCTNQNLENLMFKDNTFDIFITQDVMEHVNNPLAALKNIERVLKPGGIHIFTVPIYPFIKTRERIKITNNELKFLFPPVYHGNPIDKEGSLVTYDWGGDITEYISKVISMYTEIIEFPNSKENFRYGLEADFLQVVVSIKDDHIRKDNI